MHNNGINSRVCMRISFYYNISHFLFDSWNQELRMHLFSLHIFCFWTVSNEMENSSVCCMLQSFFLCFSFFFFLNGDRENSVRPSHLMWTIHFEWISILTRIDILYYFCNNSNVNQIVGNLIIYYLNPCFFTWDLGYFPRWAISIRAKIRYFILMKMFGVAK